MTMAFFTKLKNWFKAAPVPEAPPAITDTVEEMIARPQPKAATIAIVESSEAPAPSTDNLSLRDAFLQELRSLTAEKTNGNGERSGNDILNDLKKLDASREKPRL